MGRVESTPPPAAVEVPLPWGPVIRGVRWGAASDTILLLHEPGADLDAWGALPSRLANTLGMAAVAVDLPGHGLSDDPWEDMRVDELVRLLGERLAAPPKTALTPLPPSPGSTAEGGASLSQRGKGRRFVVAAGSVASVVLTLAESLRLAGVVLLSVPDLKPTSHKTRHAPPPSPGPTGDSPLGWRGARGGAGGRGVRANVPKLFFAGSLAGDDLETTRRLAFGAAGWSAVTSVPVSERGTRLLATPWRARIEEEIVAFLRDCQHRRPGVRPGPRITPRPAG